MATSMAPSTGAGGGGGAASALGHPGIVTGKARPPPGMARKNTLGANRFGEKRSLSTGFPGTPGLSHETERGNSFFDVDGQICWTPIASSAYYIGGGDNEKMDSI